MMTSTELHVASVEIEAPEFICSATYSPEDNKIRLYPFARLDDETFQRVKEAGYKWAPKQELFVAPKWSVKREDLALELAGEIEPEDMTLAERAEAKADRLDDIAAKRQRESSAYARAADDLSQAFYMGQPILVGHHSERKARKTQERMHAAQGKAAKAHDAIGYWQYRAEGVERYANMKNDPRVRARRIKTLLAELRDLQRRLNQAHKAVAFWQRVTTDEKITLAVGQGGDSLFLHWGAYGDLRDGKATPQELRQRAMDGAQRYIESDNLRRWIDHTLNRLAFERSMLGDVPRFGGEITPTIIQMFVREHGADKPKAQKGDGDSFIVECNAPFPLHIAQGSTLELSADEWRDLMQSCGHVPADKKPAKPPLLNIDVPAIQTDRFGNVQTREVVHMTKEEHKKAARHGGGWTELSLCGGFRFRSLCDPRWTGPRYQAPRIAAFFTDSKAHTAPDSSAIVEVTTA